MYRSPRASSFGNWSGGKQARSSLIFTMSTVKNYLSLIRFSHTIFAMPFAMIGFALGVFGWSRELVIPGWHTHFGALLPPPVVDPTVYPNSGKVFLIRLLLVVACMVFARSAAMAFNRW